MMKWIKRIFGSKRALSWFFDELMIIALFVKICLEFKVDLNILILFGILNITKLIVLGLIEIGKIIIEYKKD